MDTVLVSSQVDWLTATRKLLNAKIDTSSPEKYVASVLELVVRETGLTAPVGWVAIPTMRHYWLSFREDFTGLLLDIPAIDSTQQGLRITSTGTCWMFKSVRSLRALFARGWRPTRVDLAWNIQNFKLDIRELHERWRDFSPKSGILKPRLEGDKVNGETFYIGARASDFHVRVYDKAKESGMGGDFIRVEFELKGRYVKALFEKDFQDADACVDEMVRKAGLTPEVSEKLFNALRGAGEGVAQTGEVVVGRKATKRELWFETQVLPSFFKLATDTPDAARRVLETMRGMLEGRLDRKRG